MRTCRIIVTGKVQGVYYRQSARDKALRLGITGFVMNRADGSVEIEAQGDEALLRQLEEWCRRGPVLAKVEAVEFLFTDSPERYTRFEIRY